VIAELRLQQKEESKTGLMAFSLNHQPVSITVMGTKIAIPIPKKEDSELEHCGLCAIHCISILDYATLIIYYSLSCNMQFLSFAIMVGGTAQNFIFHYPNSFPTAHFGSSCPLE
jgi:hypothetical protein